MHQNTQQRNNNLYVSVLYIYQKMCMKNPYKIISPFTN